MRSNFAPGDADLRYVASPKPGKTAVGLTTPTNVDHAFVIVLLLLNRGVAQTTGIHWIIEYDLVNLMSPRGPRQKHEIDKLCFIAMFDNEIAPQARHAG